jgi:hypothetical protein
MWPDGNPGTPPTAPPIHHALHPYASEGRPNGGSDPNNFFTRSTINVNPRSPPRSNNHQISLSYMNNMSGVMNDMINDIEMIFANILL